KKGRPVRLDFQLLASEAPWRRSWQQEIEGTPFERVLNEAITEIVLEPEAAGTRVTIAQRQKLRGYSRTGGFLLRRATASRLDEVVLRRGSLLDDDRGALGLAAGGRRGQIALRHRLRCRRRAAAGRGRRGAGRRVRARILLRTSAADEQDHHHDDGDQRDRSA